MTSGGGGMKSDSVTIEAEEAAIASADAALARAERRVRMHCASAVLLLLVCYLVESHCAVRGGARSRGGGEDR